MNRRERQTAILRLVREQAISTQSELADALRGNGYEVVQTTISRDVADLGLVKVRAPSGRLVYAAPGSTDVDRLRAIGAAMRRYAIGVESAGNLVVVATPSGYASALAQAIDEGAHPGIAGTLAGDNTIFVAAREGTPAAGLRDELAGYLVEHDVREPDGSPTSPLPGRAARVGATTWAPAGQSPAPPLGRTRVESV